MSKIGMLARRVAIVLALVAASPAAHSRDVDAPAWTAAWVTAQQPYGNNDALEAEALTDATLRQLVRTSIAGKQLRVRVSNAFGTSPLVLAGVNVALAENPASPRIKPGTDRALTFSGLRQVTIPAGAEYVSDPVVLPVPALATLSISMHVLKHPARQSGHAGSRATSYLAAGDQLAAADLPAARKVDHWFNVTSVEVTGGKGAIAILGDSITDGYGVAPNTDQRWPDFLMERLQADPRTRGLSVLNLGIGGNRLLSDGLGPNAVARFDRDVLARDNVRFLIVFEGVNDLGTLTRDAPVSAGEHDLLVARVIAAYRQMIARARERGITVIGATISPYGGSGYYHPDQANEADRQKINAWIRQPGNFDAVIDFDALLRDPKRPERLRADYDRDGLHPSIAGYRAMGEFVPLSLFAGSATEGGER